MCIEEISDDLYAIAKKAEASGETQLAKLIHELHMCYIADALDTIEPAFKHAADSAITQFELTDQIEKGGSRAIH